MNSKILKAYCWRTGQLQLAREVPEGALELAQAPDKVMTDAVQATARLAYDNTWLVPGVPEASSDTAAVDAVIDYQKHLQKRIGHLLADGHGGGHDVHAAA